MYPLEDIKFLKGKALYCLQHLSNYWVSEWKSKGVSEGRKKNEFDCEEMVLGVVWE